MVKHIILWTLKPEFSEAEKEEIKKGIKSGLEGLMGKIEGMTEIHVIIEGLKSANVDVMLDATYVSEEALKAYSVNPLHVEVANTKVRPYTASRSCMDYEV
ncbi:MAG: Dabb family protein [Lachnospiraceae bacterium]|nr:Dabb family protein [Lachnospiraceae bacterium]